MAQSLRVLCQLGKYQRVIDCIAILSQRSSEITHIFEYVNAFLTPQSASSAVNLLHRDDSLASYSTFSDIYRKSAKLFADKHDYKKALCNCFNDRLTDVCRLCGTSD